MNIEFADLVSFLIDQVQYLRESINDHKAAFRLIWTSFLVILTGIVTLRLTSNLLLSLLMILGAVLIYGHYWLGWFFEKWLGKKIWWFNYIIFLFIIPFAVLLIGYVITR